MVFPDTDLEQEDMVHIWGGCGAMIWTSSPQEPT